jgi:hypothetical protein
VVASPSRPITAEHLAGLPGLRKAARQRLLAAQPVTVLEALRIPDVARRTTRRLLALGVLIDPERAQNRSLTLEEIRPVDRRS